MSFITYAWNRILKKMSGTACINVIKRKPCKIGAGSTIINALIDKRSFVGYDCLLLNCEVGKYCSIADQVIIGVGGEHPLHWATTSSAFFNTSDGISKGLKTKTYEPESDRTIIGNDVWIGRRAIIKKGVNVGNGAVIGASSVVTKDVPAYSIVAGVPAKMIRYRFDKELVRRFEKSKWWELPENKINELIDCIDDPETFLNHIEHSEG